MTVGERRSAKAQAVVEEDQERFALSVIYFYLETGGLSGGTSNWESAPVSL